MIDDNKKLVRRWFEEVWNQGREATIDELLSPKGIGFGLAATDTEVHGPTQFKPFVRNSGTPFLICTLRWKIWWLKATKWPYALA
ncbi:MAG TPA: hypothetical protein VFB76_04240 [Candidatus Angelobacter sp.]|nr:hypothetical protein [Candidatus Angelobacter sp.]